MGVRKAKGNKRNDDQRVGARNRANNKKNKEEVGKLEKNWKIRRKTLGRNQTA